VSTDTISDMLTRIRNANLVRHHIVQVPGTKITSAIAKLLKEEGYIEEFEEFTEQNRKYILICLRYSSNKNREPVITAIKRVSKPGLRIYVGKNNIPDVLGNIGTAILSTSKGLMTNRTAKSLGLGGEVICYIW
ncbi:unnamed protein product, partial [Chrysoparadoxa australica]